MTWKKMYDHPLEFPEPGKQPEFKPSINPEEPFLPEENPEIIPWEDPFETPPYEMPPSVEVPDQASGSYNVY